MFLFKLALALGRTVAELEDSLGSGELVEWWAYSRLEPFGTDRDNIHAAIIASTAANFSGHAKKATKLEDFILVRDDVRRDRETQKTIAMMDAMAKRNGK